MTTADNVFDHAIESRDRQVADAAGEIWVGAE